MTPKCDRSQLPRDLRGRQVGVVFNFSSLKPPRPFAVDFVGLAFHAPLELKDPGASTPIGAGQPIAVSS